MMRAVCVCGISSALLLAAGASASRAARQEPLPPGAALAAQAIECHKERATGSLIEARVCTGAAERARAADNAQQSRDWLERKNAGPCPATGPCP